MDTYTTEWNELFINEEKKFNVAKAEHRVSVKYANDVALKANKLLTTKDFFSNNPTYFHLVNEAMIADTVKNYDFQNNDGIGLVFC